MKYNLLKITFLLLLSAIITNLQAQNLYVRTQSGVQWPFAISDVKKIVFSSGDVQIVGSDNTFSYDISSLRYLNFTNLIDNGGTLVEENDHLSNVKLYPNPASEALYVELESSNNNNCSIQILSIEGKILYHELSVAKVKNINISNLAKGMYICRVYNGTTVENLKFLKQ